MSRSPGRRKHKIRKQVLVLILMTALPACSVSRGLTMDDSYQEDLYINGLPDNSDLHPRVRRITAPLINELWASADQRAAASTAATLASDESYGYTIGPRDTLRIILWDNPELVNPMGLEQDDQAGLHTVREDGTIFFPLVGTLRVSGLTTGQIRHALSGALEEFVVNPQVDVRVAEFRSKKVQITGNVADPGPMFLTDDPLTIRSALAARGGFDELADAGEIELVRGGNRHAIDIQAIFAGEVPDPILRDGDTLYVPDNARSRVFITGEVEQQAAPMLTYRGMTLLDAITEAGGYSILSADTSQVFVMRAMERRNAETGETTIVPDIYHLDGRSAPSLLLADQFELEPRDVVFVATSDVVQFNRMVSQFLPSFNVYGTVEGVVP